MGAGSLDVLVSFLLISKGFSGNLTCWLYGLKREIVSKISLYKNNCLQKKKNFIPEFRYLAVYYTLYGLIYFSGDLFF